MKAIKLILAAILVVAYVRNHMILNIQFNEYGKDCSLWEKIAGGVVGAIITGISWWYIIDSIINW